MVLKHLAIAALAAGSTYGALSLGTPESQTPIRIPASCSYETQAGEPLEVVSGPFGPRLGSLDYIASNLTHEEKIKLVSSSEFDSAGVVEQMALDLVRNHERVTDDVYRSVRRAFEEVF